MSSSSLSQAVQHTATYPLPQPLALVLEAALTHRYPTSDTESRPTAVAQLVANAWEALDALYFSEHPHEHRSSLRITVVPHQSLTILDLGSGMTRADLINSLGIGRTSHRVLQAAKKLMKMREEGKEEELVVEKDGEQHDEEEEDTVGTDQEEEEEEEEEEDETTDQDATTDDDDTTDNGNESFVLPCRQSDLGGFYSALCALGVGVKIGTKAKHDDYYEFTYGKVESSQPPDFHNFTLVRPLPEGTMPSPEHGFDQFHLVQGESGTAITMYGDWMTEGLIRPMLQSLAEKSHYRVCFSTDAEAADLLQASRNQMQQPACHDDEAVNEDDNENGASSTITTNPTQVSVKERAQYIPLRLTLGERKMLRLVEAAMACCDYTSTVDVSSAQETRRVHKKLQGITSILQGLVIACEYSAGQALVEGEEELEHYQAFFQTTLEIARRHKIMNPEKMRSEYGKLIYLLQDAVSPTVQPHLGFSVKGKIVTVYNFLKERGGLKLLDDALIDMATEEIFGRKSRAQTQADIRRKEKAVETLKRKYQSNRLSDDDIHTCLYSICDNNSFLNSNRVPIDKIIDFLTTHFSPNRIEEGYSLSIASGEKGARLSHSHERQYYFALQSLTLWRDIIDDMFRLWQMAEDDLLSETVTYALQDTGQGMQRVQQCPRTYKAMQQILTKVQQTKVRNWVGSSVIHMGDHNVPNALSFIDKYTQVPRILGPIVACLENLEQMYENSEDITKLVDDGYGGLKKLRKDILHDFFRFAFDGSGADNFYDAGSCIDGRLTSAWNWCSQLPSKPFYAIFKLTGFIGFDGEFK